ncbi:MAG: hypothetical protein A2086_08085 [Spirochaetes bacterium GWD1_27_9]|nr:MAG: hypothetical protein A2Z98_13935 [Spirochaetes bacterium GWB1_27_13]OHD28146.1 MAG: hypothetical protein A2Y34_11300 [Spirochaetes bacterium GWC1_27_15]OHD34479.1 MAG: hypothetical protein A2086_08085 [Spirochaetes bacterium GWD1_27_9]
MIGLNDIVVKYGENPILDISLEELKTLIDVEVYDDNRLLYSAKHDSSKSENVKLDITQKDFFYYTVKIKANNRNYTVPVYVLQLEEKEPYIVCDIDFTISATNAFLYLSKNLLNQKKIFHSSEVLQNLSKNYKIIYLTGRRMKYSQMTRKWLKLNEFPEGPIISRKHKFPSGLQYFKASVLKEIAKISNNAVGIGDLSSDIGAYLLNDLTAIKITHPLLYYSKNDRYDLKNGYYVVSSWKGIEKLFKEKNLFKY